ncbi:MAG: hypothetical protein JSU96_09575 [Acidobacteriota bacterium]|nr:MAG: hypothetical protein JSU96_09575 [Acidobacteriota bacterium]
MVRKSILGFLVVSFLTLSLWAQSPPAINLTAGTSSFQVRTNDIARFSGTVVDADGDPLTVTFSASSVGPISLATTTQSGQGSVFFVNSFTVPSAALGTTIVVTVTASDGNTAPVTQDLTFTVTGENRPPTVIAILADTKGDSPSNPLPSPGSIPFAVSVNDPDGHGTYAYSWGYEMLSGDFCSGEFPQIYGASAETGWVQLGALSSDATFRVSIRVTDESLSATSNFTAYVAAKEGGCLGGGGGGGTNAPTVVLSTNLPSNIAAPGQGFTASLRGTSNETISFVLRASTTNSKAAAPIVVNTSRSGCSNGCTVTKTLYAPTTGSRYYLWLDVTGNAGTTSRTLTIVVSDSGGGGGGGGGDGGGGDTTCGERNISVKSEATNTVFQVSESERADAQAGGDLRVEEVCFGNFGCENQYFTPLTEAQFLAKYGCVVKGSVRIQYRFSGETLQTAQSGATVQRSITSFPEEIEVKALPSNFTSPVYTWALNGTGTLSAQSGSTVKVNIASLPQTGGSSVVTLTATEASDPSSSAQATVTFQLTSSIVRSAQMGYSLAGQSQQKANNGTVVATSISSFPETIPLEAFEANFDEPVYNWTLVSGSGTVTAASGKTSSLRIATLNGSESGSSVVRLTVSESANPSQSVQVTVTFQLTAPAVANPPTDVSFLVSPPGGAEVDTLILLTATAVSGIGSPFDALDFSWSVTLDGSPVGVMTNRDRAVVEVPATLGTEGVLRIELVASEGGNAASPVVQQVQVKLPVQYFAHFGVGSVPGSQDELRMELVVVNDSEHDISNAFVEFSDRSGNPIELDINGDIGWNYSFALMSGVGQSLSIRSPVPETKTGWLKLSTGVRVSTIVIFKTVNSMTEEVINEVSLFPSSLGRRFTTALREGPNNNLGLALANPSSEQVTLEIAITEVIEGEKGFSMVREITLGPGGQTAMFLPEIFNRLPIPSDFAGGVLTIEVASQGQDGVIATLLRQNTGSLSTVPLAVRSE